MIDSKNSELKKSTWLNDHMIDDQLNFSYQLGYSQCAHDLSDKLLDYVYHSVDFNQQQFIMLKNYITELGIQV